MKKINGLFSVNDHCICCDSCMKIAPTTFSLATSAHQVVVNAQPNTSTEIKKAMSALKSCPVSAIQFRYE